MPGVSCSTRTLSCGMWDLVLQLEVEPGPPALGGRSLSHWTTSVCAACSVAVVSDSCHPMDCSPPGSSVHGFSQQEYWSGLLFFLQGIFATQGLNPVSCIGG